MKQYEYNVLTNRYHIKEEVLNLLGKEGWELISHTYTDKSKSIEDEHVYTFKRELEEKIDPTIAATADFLDKEKSNFDRILEREMKAFARKIGWGVEEDTVEDLLERYNNPETQKRLIGLRDEEQRKFKLDDSFKKALEEAVVSDTPVSSWMDEYKEAYDYLRNSGMFWEFHPTWTGIWDKDKYAFCHDRKFKKK